MTATIQNRTRLIHLPKTEAAIRAEFPGRSNAGLRADLRIAAKYGSVRGLSRSVALTACGNASLDEVQSVLSAEYAVCGYGRFFVGEDESGEIVAFIDQPAQ